MTEFEDAPMRFQYAIDILLEVERKLRNRNFSDDPLEDTDAECEAAEARHHDDSDRVASEKIADIEDTINNLYAIREVCPRRDN